MRTRASVSQPLSRGVSGSMCPQTSTQHLLLTQTFPGSSLPMLRMQSPGPRDRFLPLLPFCLTSFLPASLLYRELQSAFESLALLVQQMSAQMTSVLETGWLYQPFMEHPTSALCPPPSTQPRVGRDSPPSLPFRNSLYLLLYSTSIHSPAYPT